MWAVSYYNYINYINYMKDIEKIKPKPKPKPKIIKNYYDFHFYNNFLHWLL